MQDDAIFTLRQYRFDENAESFVKQVHEAVQDQVNDQPEFGFKPISPAFKLPSPFPGPISPGLKQTLP